MDAIKVFGNENTQNMVLEKSYAEYLEGFHDILTGQSSRGFANIVQELKTQFPDPSEIVTESDKKAFVKLFGEYLRIENILQNYDEFVALQAMQQLDTSDAQAVAQFKDQYHLDDNSFAQMQRVEVLSQRAVQDYRSTYNDTRDWLRRQKSGQDQDNTTLDWDDVVFEIELLKSQEINLDYILGVIFDHNKDQKDKEWLKEEVRRLIRASVGNRAKEGLLVDFIEQADLDQYTDKASIIEAFFTFAQKEQQIAVEALIREENLNPTATKRYIQSSLKREYASENGTELNETLPKMSPLNPEYKTKKQRILQKVSAFVDKFKGVGGII